MIMMNVLGLCAALVPAPSLGTPTRVRPSGGAKMCEGNVAPNSRSAAVPAAGPPAGAGGGPPPRTPLEQALDAAFDAGFALLYAAEPDGMLDSSKNLRVLWVRALLAAAGRLDDPVARELLPGASRWVVSPPLAKTVWAGVMPKLDWIRQRTEWIDETVDAFLAEHAAAAAGQGPQVVLLGAGYDTRALRYRDSAATFYEVDLPQVCDVKARLARRYLSEAAPAAPCASLAADFNQACMKPPGVFAQLEALGLQRSRPTLVVSEAVLFYCSPPAKRNLLADAAGFIQGHPGSQLVLADNLAPFVRSVAAADAAAFFAPMQLELRGHDTLWGGAIQFVRAGARP